MTEKSYEGGRVVGGCSLHKAEMPDRCQPYHHACPEARVVDCCKMVPDCDILECPHCGKQWSARCSFDEDCS